jgi:preprotein translocase subunit SecG
VLIIMLMHATNNAVSGSFFGTMFSGADAVRLGWLLAALWCAATIVVVLWAGPAHLSRKHHKQEEQGAEAPGATTAPTAPPVPRPA